MSAAVAALLAFLLATLRPRQRWQRSDRTGLDDRCGGCSLQSCEAFTDLADLDELDSESVTFGLEAVAFDCQFGVVGLDPAPSVSFAFEFSTGLVAFPAELFDRRVGGGELLAEVTDHRPHVGKFVAVIERLGEHRRFVTAGLAGSVGADAVGVGAPFAWSAAFAGDRHQTRR
jgi:hypothetical protein